MKKSVLNTMSKKILCVLAIVIVFVSTCSLYSVEAAATENYTVKVGKKVTIKTSLKNAVWGSDDTSIATVSQKGVVKGVAKGECTIVATSNGKSELFSLKVTKAKKKNVVEIYNENAYSDEKHFKDAPVVYLDGIKVTYYETTYKELLNEISKTKYTCIDYDKYNKIPKPNDIITEDFNARIMNGKNSCATIHFKYTDSRIAKDAIITSVEMDYNAPSTFYYFNTRFKVKNVPDFEDFKTEDLFSEEINWYYDDGQINGKNIVWCYQKIYASDDMMLKERYSYKSYYIYFAFDQSTHKCVYVTMQ